MRIDHGRIGWYWKRLRAMSPAEMAYRLRQQLTLRRERRLVRQGRHAALSFPAGQPITISRFFFDAPTPFSPENSAATIATADELLRGQITLFGRDLHFPDDINWQQDPLTGGTWPAVFHADVDTRDASSAGGVKWTWELNRHHHLVTLAKAYALTRDERYAATACQQLSGWLEQNPPLIGVNWTSALELALRLINWCWVIAFLQGSAHLTAALSQRLLTSIAVQTAYIARHLSGFSSANNHLIGEAAGLAFVGLALPTLPNAAQWRDTGLAILERELKLQIHPDGVPAEQAVAYLEFVLDFNLLVWRLAELHGIPAPAVWPRRLSAACDFLHHLMDGAGNVPAIGDSDDAWVIRLDDNPGFQNARSLLVSGAKMLQRGDLKAVAGDWDEKNHWLFGEAGAADYAMLTADLDSRTSRLFPTGGYAVMRAGKCVLTFDAGPLGYLSLAAHGHADALSIWLSATDSVILSDAGTYAYQEGGTWRDYFRGTAAHNTVMVDEQDQSEMQGDFLWGRKAQARICRWESTDSHDLAIAEHDGYAHLGVTHRRTVLFHKPDAVLVADDLLGSGVHTAHQLWHLPIQAHLDYTGASVTNELEAVIGTRRILFVACGEQPVSARIYQGEQSPRQGWVSPAYGHKAPAPAFAFQWHGSLPARLVTVIWLTPAARAVVPDSILLQRLEQIDMGGR